MTVAEAITNRGAPSATELISLLDDAARRLSKYFLQILAGITNANVILDPHGVLVPGAVQKIPFQVSETDFGLDAFLLCPAPYLVDFELETPDGSMLTPALPSASFSTSR